MLEVFRQPVGVLTCPRVIGGISGQGRPWAEWFLSSLPYFLNVSRPWGQSYILSPLISAATQSSVFPFAGMVEVNGLSERYKRRTILTGMSLGKHLKVNIPLISTHPN